MMLPTKNLPDKAPTKPKLTFRERVTNKIEHYFSKLCELVFYVIASGFLLGGSIGCADLLG